MRKIICALLILTMLFSLAGCSMSQEANSVNRMIISIGRISLGSEGRIIEAENAYAALPDELKDGVFLYGLLKRDRAYYDYLAAAEEYNNAIAGYNSAAASYGSMLPGLVEEYDSFYGYAAQAEQVNTMGPAYDESIREQMHSVLDAGKAFFGDRPERYESMENYSVVSKAFKGLSAIKQKMDDISGRTAELRQKTELILFQLENVSEGKEIIGVLKDSISALSDSVSVKERIEELSAKLAGLELIRDAAPGIFETGHEGTVYFTLESEHSAVGGIESSGAIEIYASPVEAGISAEKLSAMSELMGPAFADGCYLIRFAPGMPTDTGKRIASIIVASIEQ